MQWTESWWTSILHISEMPGSLWNFPQNVHKVGDFPFGIDLRSNDFRMHAHGDHSSKGRHPGVRSQGGLRKHHYEQSKWQ